MRHLTTKLLVTSSISVLVFAAPAMAQTDAPNESELRAQQIVVTGTRVAKRTALDTASPVDVIAPEALENLGVNEINQALSIALPSFNFPRPGLADGTDTVRPATLRGLAPNQTLVLVNSKRRHSAALVNVNGTVGRGSSAVDLNTIPAVAIGAIEVLRDGASAQYGSDAIAGVINVRLREAKDGGSVGVSYGARITEYSVPVGIPPAGIQVDDGTRKRTDGQQLIISGWKGFSIGENGFLTVSGEIKNAERTERSGVDVRQQYPLVGGALDPRENTINRYNAWYGEPEVEQFTGVANAGLDLKNGVNLYGWAGFQTRDAVSAGFYRRAVDARNTIAIYPDGFLPQIAPTVTDYSAGGGAEWKLGDWAMDTSLVYGSNKMEYTIQNTLNRSLGPTSKTVFDAGGFEASSLTFNTSAVKGYMVGLASPLNVAVGLEMRQDFYEIFAGEPDSYRTGTFGGAGGSQVFPGFQPSNVVDKDRTAIGVYVDLEANVTEQLLLSGALRAEDYSDFGENVSGKVAARYDFNDSIAIRGSVQTGFRAPSLQQQFFTSTATNNVNGTLIEVGTFPSTSPVGLALGGVALDAETSTNFALGAVFRFDGGSMTIDAYRINVDDRITLSENITGAAAVAALQAQGIFNASSGRYFLNGVDTETTGVDMVLTFGLKTADMGDFDFTFGANLNETKVTRSPEPFVTGTTSFVRFGRVASLTFEEGTPKDKFSANVAWELGDFGATFRATRYGEVLSPGTTQANDLILPPETLIDLEGRWSITENVLWALGADNVFDTYPLASPINLNGTGNTPFSNYSPFGRSGRYVYTRLVYNF
jgi:iron complex outermembrane recepter protein